ncbi:N-acetylmuramoyl-L-alanine amidase [Paenibacillus sp. IB182496]|uniref:N-acetylmuramoyl-L-alanine amidase n=1 Tax=Paenibacillus sabuli TaxID=2772509 RepID=A0A927BTE0_9BACL|nr:N-acetylmuramoyl-L-alanine amidase [Paenibacillus sabuli]MBD2846448.1 N-acetylmuramoyl-L-alanine amidase [Paenibacillus sabuli]
MSYCIAIDDGHGMATAGKRTPVLPAGMTGETGGFMHENEFNRRVAALLKEQLEAAGLRTMLVAPTDADTPLAARTAAANRARADLYVSIHANAIGSDAWNHTRGIETYHHPSSAEGRRAATCMHRALVSRTRQTDRGVKTANFYVLRYTAMPAVLVECGFMTNVNDAELLLSETYRRTCAEALAAGIRSYFGVAADTDDEDQPAAAEPAADHEQARGGDEVQEITIDLIDTRLGAKRAIKGLLKDDTAYVELRTLAAYLGAGVGWDNAAKRATVVKS